MNLTDTKKQAKSFATSKYAGHTPGPWFLSERFGPCAVMGADRYQVAETEGVQLHEDNYRDDKHWASTSGAEADRSEQEQEVNARLIADAPTILAQRDELLVALQAIDEAMPDSSSPKDMALFAAGLQNAARTAIASVEGGAQ